MDFANDISHLTIAGIVSWMTNQKQIISETILFFFETKTEHSIDEQIIQAKTKYKAIRQYKLKKW